MVPDNASPVHVARLEWDTILTREDIHASVICGYNVPPPSQSYHYDCIAKYCT